MDFGINTTPTARRTGARAGVHGGLDLATCQEFKRAAEDASAGGRPLIVDLTGCSFLDSSGLRAILQIHGALGNGNCPAVPMAVVIGDSPARRLFSLTEVDKRLSVFDSREEADEWLALEARRQVWSLLRDRDHLVLGGPMERPRNRKACGGEPAHWSGNVSPSRSTLGGVNSLDGR